MEEEEWLKMCDWLRSHPLSDDVLTQRMAFGLSFPCRWRGKSTFNPVRATLLQNILGEDWYEQIYNDPKSIFLTPDTFQQWRQNMTITKAIADNLQYWIDSSHTAILLTQLSAVGWAKMLQVALDFNLSDSFKLIWDKCTNLDSWSPDELALFFQIY